MEELPDLHRDPEAAAEMAANAVLFYLRNLDLREKEAKLYWIHGVLELAVSKLPR